MTPAADVSGIEDARWRSPPTSRTRDRSAKARPCSPSCSPARSRTAPRTRAAARPVADPDLEEVRRLVEEALEHVGGDRALRVRALLGLGTYPLEHGDVAQAERLAREASRSRNELGDPLLLAAALMCAANVATSRVDPNPRS